MKITDEIIQELIEAGKLVESDSDGRAYQIVFDALKKEPDQILSSSFASQVVNKLNRLKEQRELRRDYFWLGFGLFLLVVATIVSILLVDFSFASGAFKFLGQYPLLFVMAAIMILGFQWLEKQLLNRKVSEV